MQLSGPMFEPSQTQFWHSHHDKSGGHYNNFSLINEEEQGMSALRSFFPEGEANEYNLCFFSTSGVHGSYCKIEEVECAIMEEDEDGMDHVTFVIFQSRICTVRCGNVYPKTTEDFEFLKKLRQSTWEVSQTIGNP